MFDIDLFIQCVQERPALWEKSAKDYSDKNKKEKAWLEIGEIMYSDWHDLDLLGRDVKVKDMKDKWKNIRDSFVKHEKQGKSGDPTAKNKKYIYADALSFLLQTLEKRKTSGNVEEEVDEEKHQEAVRNVEDDTEESHAASALSYVPQTKYRQRAKASITPFQNELLKKLSDTSKQDEMDVDKAFLFSLLPDYKQLNAADKFNFKIMNLQFFENIRRTKHTQNMQP
ncbi:uncharacterized protein LOC126992277 [Eriocheir sinensis]|uniref:uncharacterized protein LOC126992277 n=1 Tax=Eriocheir sinensis TaxID=95602 RepID=UPI0021C78899|nr:uncharacterized protein LOC126992277 [Eriocheir sinensis]